MSPPVLLLTQWQGLLQEAGPYSAFLCLKPRLYGQWCRLAQGPRRQQAPLKQARTKGQNYSFNVVQAPLCLGQNPLQRDNSSLSLFYCISASVTVPLRSTWTDTGSLPAHLQLSGERCSSFSKSDRRVPEHWERFGFPPPAGPTCSSCHCQHVSREQGHRPRQLHPHSGPNTPLSHTPPHPQGKLQFHVFTHFEYRLT